jgi:hypothetical protein
MDFRNELERLPLASLSSLAYPSVAPLRGSALAHYDNSVLYSWVGSWTYPQTLDEA